ncbi:MAG: hypothetical protein LBF59_02735 [Prevotellaceae bacterium]|jgi:hypothetical protein|nr:hypothetical protein [Prevotellaceae bacterium]
MKKVIRMKYLLPVIFAVLLLSCSKNSEPAEPGAPVISFASGNDERKLKLGESVTLTAIVENAEQPVFAWTIEGKIVSTETGYTFVAEKLGEYFVNFRVDAVNGSAEGQIKISVFEKVPPQITMPPAAIAFAGIDMEFVAEVENAENATYRWRLNDEIVSESDTYVFNRTETGDYLLNLQVATEDGEDLHSISVKVLPGQTPELFFDNGRYRSPDNANELRKMTVPIGRNLVLAPVIVGIDSPAAFEWKVDGATQTETGEYFTFTPSAEGGVYRIAVSEISTGATAEVEVTCTPPEDVFFRKDGENKYATQAFYYMPAPGQFVNSILATNQTEALNILQDWCGKENGFFHIGAFGGYWIVGFDHSVENKPDVPDIKIKGNAFNDWCESGIVWVMQDNNGNGQPDDTWFELKGSETGKTETKQRYALTYYKPATADYSALWIDNMGHAGMVSRGGGYPKFIAETYYTLVGTCLNSTFGIESGSGFEISKCYEWGYADGDVSEFWIENAVQVDGSPANLKHIDFVKVSTAVNAQGAIVGEISTEAYIPTDMNFD